MNYFHSVTTLLLSVAVLPLMVVADDFAQHAAHEHGVAMLNLVQENGQVMIELNSPTANIVGFEHHARDDEQRAVVQKAHHQLTRAGDLFAFAPQAECQVTKADLDGEIFAVDTEETHANHKEHQDDRHHRHHAKHKEHDQENHHEHHEDHHQEASHSDIIASYIFSCKNPSAVSYVDILLFEVFRGFEEIDAQVISSKGQSAIELTINNHRINL